MLLLQHTEARHPVSPGLGSDAVVYNQSRVCGYKVFLYGGISEWVTQGKNSMTLRAAEKNERPALAVECLKSIQLKKTKGKNDQLQGNWYMIHLFHGENVTGVVGEVFPFAKNAEIKTVEPPFLVHVCIQGCLVSISRAYRILCIVSYNASGTEQQGSRAANVQHFWYIQGSSRFP